MLDYIPSLVGFAAVLLGVRGGTWDDSKRGWKRITPTGIFAFVLGMLALIVSFLQVAHSQREADFQKSRVARVRLVAERELHDAMRECLWPFEELYDNICLEFHDRDYQPARFMADFDYSINQLTADSFIAHFDFIAPREQPKHTTPFPELTWSALFSESATRANHRIESVLSKYSAYLEPETIANLTDIQNHDIFRRFLDAKILIEPYDNLEDALRGPQGYGQYKDFVKRAYSTLKSLAPSPRWPQAPSRATQSTTPQVTAAAPDPQTHPGPP